MGGAVSKINSRRGNGLAPVGKDGKKGACRDTIQETTACSVHSYCECSADWCGETMDGIEADSVCKKTCGKCDAKGSGGEGDGEGEGEGEGGGDGDGDGKGDGDGDKK